MIETDVSPLARRDDETPLQHHKRLIYGKLLDKTLSEFDYSELSKYVYGKEYAGDVARRMFYGSSKTLALVEEAAKESNQKSGGEYSNDIELRLRELQKERQRFFDQRREYNKIISAEGRTEHLYSSLTDAANRLAETVGCAITNTYFSPRCAAAGGDDGAYKEAVLVLSDWHYGLKTNNVFNQYNTDICKARLNNVVKRAIQKIEHNRCNKLHVVVLGDLIHGGIHVSARVASEELICDQLMQASELLAQAIIALAESVPEVDVHVTYGNHGRTIPNKGDSIHRDNLERIIPWWLETRLLAEERRVGDILNINVIPDDGNEFVLFDSCGHGFCASHGDLDSLKGSPRLLTTLFQKSYGKDIEYILLGDKHHRASYSELGVDALLCGSLCGTDDFANDKRLYSTPSQLLLIVTPSDGVDGEYRIKCD